MKSFFQKFVIVPSIHLLIACTNTTAQEPDFLRFDEEPLYLHVLSAPIGQVESSPAIADDGIIFVGSNYGYIYAFRNQNSALTLLDRYRPPNGIYAVNSSPAVLPNRRVIVTFSSSRGGSILSLLRLNDIDKFEVLGSVSINGSTRSSPFVGFNDRIFVGTDAGILYSLSLKDKGVEVEDQIDIGYAIWSSPIQSCQGVIVVGSDDGWVYAFTTDRQGKLNQTHRFDTKARVRSSGVIIGDRLFIGSDNGHVYSARLTSRGLFESLDDIRVGDLVRSSPAIGSNGTVFVHAEENADALLVALGLDAKGQLKELGRLSVPIPDNDKRKLSRLRSSPAIFGQDLIVWVSEAETIKVLRFLVNGRFVEEGSSVTGNWTTSSPAVAPDGKIYVGTKLNKSNILAGYILRDSPTTQLGTSSFDARRQNLSIPFLAAWNAEKFEIERIAGTSRELTRALGNCLSDFNKLEHKQMRDEIQRCILIAGNMSVFILNNLNFADRSTWNTVVRPRLECLERQISKR